MDRKGRIVKKENNENMNILKCRKRGICKYMERQRKGLEKRFGS